MAYSVYHAGVELTNVVDVRITKTLNAKSNTVEIILNNYAQNLVVGGNVLYKPDDIIKIYAAPIVDINNTSHLLGTFNILDITIQPDNKTVKIKCGDKTYVMLNKIFVGDENRTINSLISLIVQRVNQDGSSNGGTVTTHIATTTSTGGGFPTIRFASAYKTAYDCIAELSQPENTGDKRTYLFWFDENGEFWWQYPSLVPVSTFTYGVDPVLAMNVDKTEAESVAMIIYDAGTDKNDTEIVDFYVDPDAGSIKNKMRYQPMTDISKLLKRQFTNDGTYTAMTNDDFVDYCRAAAIARCTTIISKIGKGLWQATINVEGANYATGDLYTVAAPAHGFPSSNLRLERVVHTMNKNGWGTLLTLTQDPAEV